MSGALSKIAGIAAAIAKYGQMAIVAVAQVQAEIGASNGDKSVQETKLQLAISYVLAAAHAGENVPVSVVQEVATAVEMAANIGKALGLAGKTASPTVTVAVPPAAGKAAA